MVGASCFSPMKKNRRDNKFPPGIILQRSGQGARYIMTYIIQSCHTPIATIQKRFADAVIIDVTSRGEEPWVRFSPFYPHGNIPIPFSPGHVSASVEGIWQGLKVFKDADVNTSKFSITTMKGIKRTVRSHGEVLGHRKGVDGTELLSYIDARRLIYLPVYRWVLEHCLQVELAELQKFADEKTVVLLDYETNDDIEFAACPLSHAGLVKRYLENNWP